MGKILSVIFTIGLAYIMANYTSESGNNKKLFEFDGNQAFYKIICLITGDTDTTDAGALYRRAEDSYNYEDYEYAIKDYERAFKLDSSYTYSKPMIADCYLALNDTSEAISVLKAYLPIAQYKDEVYNKLGKIYVAGNDLSQAEEYFKEAIAINGTNATAQASLSSLYLQKRDYEKALEHISNVISLYSDNTDYINIRRRIYLKMDKPELAKLDFKHILEIDAYYFPDYGEKAKTAKGNEEYQTAINYYNLALELDFGNLDYINDRGWSYYYLEKYDSAYIDFTTLIEGSPDDYYYHFTRAYVLDALGRVEESIADYTKSISLKGDYHVSYNNRGYGYFQLKKYDLAEKDYTKSIELKDDYYLSYFNRGLVYHDTGKFEKAIADYKKALQYSPENKTLIYDMALAYEELKDSTKAVDYFNEYVRIAGSEDTTTYNFVVKRIAALSNHAN